MTNGFADLMARMARWEDDCCDDGDVPFAPVTDMSIVEDTNGTWVVASYSYPEVTTFGATLTDAIGKGRRAIEEAKAARAAENGGRG